MQCDEKLNVLPTKWTFSPTLHPSSDHPFAGGHFLVVMVAMDIMVVIVFMVMIIIVVIVVMVIMVMMVFMVIM